MGLFSPGSFLAKLGGGLKSGVEDVLNPAHGTPESGQVNAAGNIPGASTVINDVLNPAGGTPLSGQVNPAANPVIEAVNQLPGKIPGAPAGSTIVGGLNAGLNIAQSNLSQYAQENFHGGVGSTSGFNEAAQISQEQSQAMTAAGYDASNPVSVLAYQAKGYAHTDTADLAAGWDKSYSGLYGWDGEQAVLQAEQFREDPTKFETSLLQDVKDGTMTQQQASDLLQDPKFANLVNEVAGRSATLGNDFAQGIGLDPVKDSELYKLTTAGVDTAAAFALDPINVAGGAYQTAKFNAIGLKNLPDGEDIRAALDPNSINPIKSATVRGAQSFLDDMSKLRTGLDAGTEEGETQAAMAYAHANAATPGWMPLAQDVTGARQFADATGKEIYNAAPITTLQEFTDYLVSKNGLLRLTSGQAPVESKLLPGMMSAFGYRFMKGNAAAALVGRSRTLDMRIQRNLTEIIADPANAVDAVTGEKFADEAAEAADAAEPGLQSQSRAAQRGDNQLASMQGLSPDAVAQRARLAVRRLTTNLPRNTQISLADSDGPDKILKAGLTYLSRADANLLAARFARGGEGVQKSVIDGLNLQTAHAAGTGTTDAGRALNERLPDLNAQTYGHLPNGKITDPATGIEHDAAISVGQLQPTFHLVNFADMHRAAAKTGLWQQTVGRVFNNEYADVFQDYERAALLVKPNVGIRNMIEGQGNIAIRGDYGHFIQSRQVLVDAAKRAGDDAVAAAKQAGETNNKTLFSIRRKAQGEILTNRKAVIDKAVRGLALDRVGTLYRNVVLNKMDPERLAYMREALEGAHAEDWRPRLDGYSQGIQRSALDPHGVEGSTMILNDGLQPAKLTRAGYAVGPAGGVAGADRLGHSLSMYFNQDTDLNHALIEAARSPNSDVSGVVAALKAPHMSHLVDQAERAHSYVDAQGATRRAITPEQKDLALEQWARHYVDNAKYLLTDTNGDHIQSVADYIDDHGKAPSAKWINENLPDELRPNGALGPEWRAVAQNGKLGFVRLLLDSAGKAFKWLVEDPIKRTTSEPAFLMNYANQRVRFAREEANMRGALEDASMGPLQERHTFEQVEAAAGRKQLIPGSAAGPARPETDEEMATRHQAEIEGVKSKAATAADNIIDGAAYKSAYAQTESMIDDPGLKTQADVVGRNYLMFSRAVNAFARRWGQLALEDPTRLRKLMLINEGMHHAGLTYLDANGNLNFTYPGSDVAMKAMARLNSIVPGLGTGVTYGMSGALTGQVNMIAPGMDNPGRVSLSPSLNIAAHELEKLAPQDKQLFDQIDTALNGQAPSGQAWYSELVPGAISKWTAATNSDRSSALNSATISAVMYLEASDPYYNVPDADLPPGAKRIVPGPSATPQDVATYLHNIQQQVRNQLYLRAAFGEFAPAAPGLPDESVPGSGADPLFSASGVQNLSDEYKQLLTASGGDRALATSIFVANHPGRLVFTEPTTQSTTNKAYLPDTASADQWINGNLSFIGKYPTLSAYFVPQDPGQFDLGAYRAQMETGLRQKDTPTEFLTAYMNTTAGITYYQSLDAKDAAVQQALASGNTAQASAIRSAFDTWSTQFNAVNPTWAASQASQPAKEEDARNAVANLIKLTDDPHVPSAVKPLVPVLKTMIASYQNQQQWLAENPGTTAADIVLKQQELTQYEDFMLNLTKSAPGAKDGVQIGYDDAGNPITGTANPNLINIYNGVFKPLNFQQPATAGG